MPKLLVVHHTPSPSVHSMLLGVLDGAADPLLSDVEVVTRAALSASASDVLGADGVIVGGPVNLGYVAGALKHFFDQIYYPCLEETARLPFGAFLHGNDDLTGGLRALEVITTGLRWRRVQPVVEVVGAPDAGGLDACRELGAAVAASLLD